MQGYPVIRGDPRAELAAIGSRSGAGPRRADPRMRGRRFARERCKVRRPSESEIVDRSGSHEQLGLGAVRRSFVLLFPTRRQAGRRRRYRRLRRGRFRRRFCRRSLRDNCGGACRRRSRTLGRFCTACKGYRRHEYRGEDPSRAHVRSGQLGVPYLSHRVSLGTPTRFSGTPAPRIWTPAPNSAVAEAANGVPEKRALHAFISRDDAHVRRLRRIDGSR